MASSTVMDQNLIGSINVDDLLNIYSGDPPSPEQVWSEIVAGKSPGMTLEDFLTKAGAVAPGDVATVDVASGDVAEGHGRAEEGGFRERERRRRREVEEPMDRASQQRQRRMIKNRESAARSRERKQAYTVELEALVMHLEEDNARLVREGAERSRKRFKKLMENLIPVGERERPPIRAHRRVHSVGW